MNDTAGQNEAPAAPPRTLRDRAEIAAQIATLTAQARREIAIFAPELDPTWFNTPALDHALAGFVAQHRHNRARFLVENARQIVADNSRLVARARQFSEFLEIRRVGEQHAGQQELFVLVDRTGFLHQRDLGRPECLLDLNNRRHAVELVQRFQEMWDHSEPISDIRTTGL
jgi:hypothetical protein